MGRIDSRTNLGQHNAQNTIYGCNGTASFDSAANTVTFTHRDIVRTLQLGVPLPDGMGTPMMPAGRTFVPMRYAANLFGAEVRWDGAARAVYLY